MPEINVAELANHTKRCECGRVHTVPIKKIVSGAGALFALRDILADFRGRKVFLVGDRNTMPLAEREVRDMLSEAGCAVSSHTFQSEKHLVLDEPLIGAMLVHMPKDTDLVIAIGSGTLNDLCRVIAAYCKIPHVIIGTAPSMDGYASAVSPIVVDGGKHSFPLCVPYAILADTALMKTAPDVMLSAGVGDILGKYFALCDWKLAEREIDEPFCPYIAGMVARAVERCVNGIDGVKSRSEDAIKDMADTLILSGAAIAMHGISSRPASGSEHQLAHHWEHALLEAEDDAPLHGNLVGFGTQAAARLYALAAREFDLDFPPYRVPAREEITGYMARLGDYATPEALGVTRELFYESFFHATGSNDRYTLIMHLQKKNRLGHYAKLVTEEFYG